MVMVHATSSIALYNKTENKKWCFTKLFYAWPFPVLLHSPLDADEWGTDKGRSLHKQV